MTFFWSVLILVLTPGATTAVVMRQALIGGRRAGITAAAGAAVANSLQAIAARAGLAVVLARLPAVAVAIRIGGSLYLLWLAWQSLRRAARPGPSPAERLAGAADGRASAFRDGLTVNLLNPPITTFYLVVVPGFLEPGADTWAFARLAAIHITMAFVCHVGWCLVVDSVRTATRSGAGQRAHDAATGAALIFLAVRTLLTGTGTR